MFVNLSKVEEKEKLEEEKEKEKWRLERQKKEEEYLRKLENYRNGIYETDEPTSKSGLKKFCQIL